MLSYLMGLIQERKQQAAHGEPLADNMLNRLIGMQAGEGPSFSDDLIARNLAGVFMGALEPINKACVHVLQQFFARKKILHQAIEAAKRNDVQTIGELALEAMRFHPNMPLLMRYSKSEQRLGRRRIRAGQTVYTMTYSAMFDPRQVEKPRRFRPGRPADEMMYYGFGQHRCFGTYINLVAIPEILTALLKIEDLHPKEKLINEGPFPEQWMFERR